MVYSEPTADSTDSSLSGWFEFRISLTGMDPDDILSVVLPAKSSGVTVSELLDQIFPPAEEEQRAVVSMFDLRANPDLPEIYAVFLDAFDARRKGRCTLSFSGGGGMDVDLSGLASQQLDFSSAGAVEAANERLPLPPFKAKPQKHPTICHPECSEGSKITDLRSPTGAPRQILRHSVPQNDSFRTRPPISKEGSRGFLGADVENISSGVRQSPYPRLQIQINQQYRAVEYATGSGFWGSKQELLEWLQSLTVLYFLDKHEVEIPAPLPSGAGTGGSGAALTAAAGNLQSKGLIACSADTQTFVITEEGRGFIGQLLSETESYIDLYDHFKDTGFDLDGETLDADRIEFDTGRGVDLRVQVFLAEGLDPVRTVFLLRLYDGTLDGFVSTWKGLIDEESFFDGVLEPVVNRCEVDEAVIGQIVDIGYGFLEERAERRREMESQLDIINRVWA